MKQSIIVSIDDLMVVSKSIVLIRLYLMNSFSSLSNNPVGPCDLWMGVGSSLKKQSTDLLRFMSHRLSAMGPLTG